MQELLITLCCGGMLARDVRYFYVERSFDMEINKQEVEDAIDLIKKNFIIECNSLIELQEKLKNAQLEINSLKMVGNTQA